MPTTPTLLCDKCRTVLPGALLNTPEPVACPGCHSALRARVFPAFSRPPAAARAVESVASDEDASCFYHPRKKATVPCGRCGRFLCALCDLELDGRHLCPGCVEAGRKAADGRSLLREGLPLPERILHDSVALLLAWMPLLLWPFTLFTAPVALFLVVRYWNEPARSPVPRWRWRLVVAGGLSLVQIVGWVYGLYRLFDVSTLMKL